MFSYFVQGESVYAVALHICSLWHDKHGSSRWGEVPLGGKREWDRGPAMQTAANWQLLVQKKTALLLKKSSWQCCKLLWRLPLPLPLLLLLILLQAVAIVPGYGSAIALLKILMLQSLLGKWREKDRIERRVGFPAYARCGTRMQAQDAVAAPASAPALALLPIVAISRIQYKWSVRCSVCRKFASLGWDYIFLLAFCVHSLLFLSLSIFLSPPSYWQLPRPRDPLLQPCLFWHASLCYVNAFPCCCSAYP